MTLAKAIEILELDQRREFEGCEADRREALRIGIAGLQAWQIILSAKVRQPSPGVEAMDG